MIEIVVTESPSAILPYFCLHLPTPKTSRSSCRSSCRSSLADSTPSTRGWPWRRRTFRPTLPTRRCCSRCWRSSSCWRPRCPALPTSKGSGWWWRRRETGARTGGQKAGTWCPNMWWRSEEKSDFREILKIIYKSFIFGKIRQEFFLLTFRGKGDNERYCLVIQLNQLMWLQFCFLTTF